MTESLNIILMSNDWNNSVGVFQNTEVNAAVQHGSRCASGDEDSQLPSEITYNCQRYCGPQQENLL